MRDARPPCRSPWSSWHRPRGRRRPDGEAQDRRATTPAARPPADRPERGRGPGLRPRAPPRAGHGPGAAQADEPGRVPQGHRRASQVARTLAELKARNPSRYELALDVWKARSRVELIAARLAGRPERGARSQLRLAIEARVDAEVRRQRFELEQAEAAARKAREALDRLENHRDAIVETRLRALQPQEGPGRPKAAEPDAPSHPDPAIARPAPGRTAHDPPPRPVGAVALASTAPAVALADDPIRAGPRAVRRRGRRRGPRLPAPRPAPDGPARLQHPVVPRLVPGPGRASGSPSSATTSRPTTTPCSRQDSGRVDLDDPEGCKILQKPTLAIPHKGGKRLDAEGWQYRLLVRWIEAGAKGVENATSQFERLEVTPAEVVFTRGRREGPAQGRRPLGRRQAEDVTCLTRFRTNDESIAEVDEDGVVTAAGRATPTSSPSTTTASPPPRSSGPSPTASAPKYPDVADPDEGRRAGRRQAPEARGSSPARPAPTPSSSAGSASTWPGPCRRPPRSRRSSSDPSPDEAGPRRSTNCSPGRPTPPGGRPSSATSPATPPGAQRPAGRAPGPPPVVRLDLQAGGREHAVRQARRRDRPGHQPRQGARATTTSSRMMAAAGKPGEAAKFADRETCPTSGPGRTSASPRSG